ncbi:TPA: hypothetical protein JBI63_08690 [Legionella pneumophila]|nr:hypothetical protein [Legionella pneumophila subsp. pneumophila]HAU1452107.1 hypothetical protein [Legionella pneumophila]HAU1471102.1 hypothetical protein [Legionella pneumophila]
MNRRKNEISDARLGLLKYLSKPDEKGNGDLIRSYFRSIYPDFRCETQAENADGYVPGHFILELKSSNKDWYSGLLQALCYKKSLDVTLIIVASHDFIAIWDCKNIPVEIMKDIYDSNLSASKLGVILSKKYQQFKNLIIKTAIWKGQALTGLFGQDKERVLREIIDFEKVLENSKKVKLKITLKNFTDILKEMSQYFVSPIKAVSAFYTMIDIWDRKYNSYVEFNPRFSDRATFGGVEIRGINSEFKINFKEFAEKYYIQLKANEDIDEFFSQYDRAIDAVDKKFRIKNGIFFTDLDLSKFSLWYVKQHINNLGKDYLVIDPACGSGNLITNWRSPLQLRHKVVSEIEPELLYTVENRMKGDSWHNGKFTVIPKVEEGRGLNFLDKSAEEYIKILKVELSKKGLELNKPIAFLCNPPYRGDDSQAAEKIDYPINEEILKLIGEEARAERYSCFLAQMKLICDKAPESGIPEKSVLLVFTKASWLTNRPSFKSVQKTIFDSFDFIDGFLVNSKEFFDVKVQFPIAFTIWKYKDQNSKTMHNDNIFLRDLTWITKKDLQLISWVNNKQTSESGYRELDIQCNKVLEDARAKRVSLNLERGSIRSWMQKKLLEFMRNRRKDEVGRLDIGGLPKFDRRLSNKKVLGDNYGLIIGFMDDLTPCRVAKGSNGNPWFRLNTAFMDIRKIRCTSGPTPVKSYEAFNLDSAISTFFWYALAKTLIQCGYPLWADALQFWAPQITKQNNETIIKYIFSIGLADNECVETVFPGNNPQIGVPEVYVENPLTPNNPESFWSKTMAPFFINKNCGDDLPYRLVHSVIKLYQEWEKRFIRTNIIEVNFSKPYFISKGFLKKSSGIIQIRDYAESTDDQILMELLSEVRLLLRETKNEFYNYLVSADGLNYFTSNIVVNEPNKTLSSFDLLVEKRLALAALIIDNLYDDPNLGRTKLAKTFYLIDVHNKLNLQSKYYRDAAGPMDSRAFYNKKNGIEPLGMRLQYFTILPGEKTQVKYQKEQKFANIVEKSKRYFEDKLPEIKRLVEIFKSLDTKQSEILVTLYACWNDLLIDKGAATESEIIEEYLHNWHVKKKSVPKERLQKALKWMQKNNLIPMGDYKSTHTYVQHKMKNKTENDFF